MKYSEEIVATGGIVLILLGILASPWVAGALLSPDGELSSPLYQAVFCAAALALVSLGGLAIAWRRRIRLGNVVLFAASCAVALLLAEALAAAAGAQANRRAVSEVPELVPWWTCDARAGCRYLREKMVEGAERFNRDGFHDSDEFTATAAASARRRVLLLGDSFAFGASADPGEGFADILERGLDETLLWNTAIPGNGQRDELVVLREYFPRLEPDLVLLAFYMNDYHDNVFPPGKYYTFTDGTWILRYQEPDEGDLRVLSPEEAYFRAFPQPRGTLQRLETSRLISLVLNTASRLEARYHAASAGMAPRETDPHHPLVASTGKLLEEIRASVAAGGSRLLVMIVPARGDLAGAHWRYRGIIRLCGELGLECFEVRDRLATPDYDRDHPLDSHWTNAGHRKVGEALLERVRDIWRQRQL